MIGPGSLVVALRDGGHDNLGLPLRRPEAGHVYVVGETYEMPYGLGCTLVGMDAEPYRGYILHRKSKKNPEGTWYFQELFPDLRTDAILRAMSNG